MKALLAGIACVTLGACVALPQQAANPYEQCVGRPDASACMDRVQFRRAIDRAESRASMYGRMSQHN